MPAIVGEHPLVGVAIVVAAGIIFYKVAVSVRNFYRERNKQ